MYPLLHLTRKTLVPSNPEKGFLRAELYLAIVDVYRALYKEEEETCLLLLFRLKGCIIEELRMGSTIFTSSSSLSFFISVGREEGREKGRMR